MAMHVKLNFSDKGLTLVGPNHELMAQKVKSFFSDVRNIIFVKTYLRDKSWVMEL